MPDAGTARGGRAARRAALALAGAVLAAAPLTALGADGSWGGGLIGNFADPAAWVGGSVPGNVGGNSSGDTATFAAPTAIADNVAVTVDADRNVRNVLFAAVSGTFTFSGGPLTLSGDGSITADQGRALVRINAPLVISGNALLNNGARDNVGNWVLNNGITSTASGAHTLTLQSRQFGGVSTYNQINGNITNPGGGSMGLTMNGGPWRLTGTNSFSGPIFINPVAANTYPGQTAAINGSLFVQGDEQLGAVPAVPATTNTSNGAINIGRITNLTFEHTGSATLHSNRTLFPASIQGPSWGSLRVANANATLTYGGLISPGAPSSGLRKGGPGLLILTGTTNSNTGGFHIEAGSLQVFADGVFGNPASVLRLSAATLLTTTTFTIARPIGLGAFSATTATNVGSFDVGAASTLTLTGNITNIAAGGIGSLRKAGPGTLVLSGSVAHTGVTIVDAGVMQVGAGGTTGVLTAAHVTVNATGTLAFNRSNTVTPAVPISGAGTVVQSGSGTLAFSTAQPYTGPTFVNAGILAVNAAQTSGSPYTVASGGTLAGTASLASTVSVLTGGVVRPSAANGTNATTFTVSSLSLSDGSVTAYALVSDTAVGGTVNDLLNVTGDVSIPAGNHLVRLTRRTGSLAQGTYTLLDYGTLSGAGTFALEPGSVNRAYALAVDNTAGALTLVVSGNDAGIPLTWSGSPGTANWDVFNTANFKVASPNDSVFYTGDGVTFDDSSSFHTVTVSTAVAPSSMTIDTAGTYTFTGSGAISSAVGINSAGSLTKTGAGLAVFHGNNAFGGPITISAGSVQIGDGVAAAGTLGAGPITNEGALIFSRAGSLTVTSPLSGAGSLAVNVGTVVFTGASTATGPVSVGPGALMQVGVFTAAGSLGSGPVNIQGQLNLSRTGDLAVTAPLSGPGNVRIGAGTVTLSGALSFTGNLIVTNIDSRLVSLTPIRPVTGSLSMSTSRTSLALNVPTSTSSYTTVLEVASMTLGTASQAAASTVTVAATDRSTHLPAVVVTSALTIPARADTTLTGFLDLANNDLIVRGGAANAATLRSYLRVWLTTGTSGIGASSASPSSAPFTTLSLFVNSTPGFAVPDYTAYDGVTGLTAADVIVRYTYVGDTNIDGVLDARDFNAVLSGFSNQLTGADATWRTGDVNHDGVVDASDWTLFLDAYTHFNTVNPPGLGNGLDAGGGTGGAVPEPAAVSLLALLAPALGRRRRAAH